MFAFFDFYVLPIAIIVLYTYTSKQIKKEKEKLLSLRDIKRLDMLLWRDPRPIFFLFWLVTLYESFFK